MTSPGRPACREYGRIFLCGDAFERCFNLIDSLRQLRAAERLKRVNCFCNCNLRPGSLSMACRQLYRTSRSMAHTAIFPRFDPEHNGTWSTVHFATGQPTEFLVGPPRELSVINVWFNGENRSSTQGSGLQPLPCCFFMFFIGFTINVRPARFRVHGPAGARSSKWRLSSKSPGNPRLPGFGVLSCSQLPAS
jgi:hypothetical protein